MNKNLIRSDIQGLRAIAIFSVLIFHAWEPLLPGGFVGVDVFFVISGFVITRTINRDFDAGGFSVSRFYRHRVRRIFPALYTMVLFVGFVSLFILTPQGIVELAKSALSTVFFSSNMFFFRVSDYFDGAASLKPLLHT